VSLVVDFQLLLFRVGSWWMLMSSTRLFSAFVRMGCDVVVAREARSKALGDRKPASTLIVGGLANPAWKIEIEGIAVA
jgi:enamine deaminase RidA (YjgF/YER057c/UK114 family)